MAIFKNLARALCAATEAKRDEETMTALLETIPAMPVPAHLLPALAPGSLPVSDLAIATANTSGDHSAPTQAGSQDGNALPLAYFGHIMSPFTLSCDSDTFCLYVVRHICTCVRPVPESSARDIVHTALIIALGKSKAAKLWKIWQGQQSLKFSGPCIGTDGEFCVSTSGWSIEG